MPENLFAACGNRGDLNPKRIRMDASVQNEVEDLFTQQETSFFEGITDEVLFDGRWRPDANEILTIDSPPEATFFEATINKNASSVDDIDIAGFAEEGIRAIFTGSTSSDQNRVLVQRFTAGQILSRARSYFSVGNTFRRFEQPVFSLDHSLTCIIEGGTIKFKSMHKMRSIINMTDIYRAATDDEVRDFASHANFVVGNIDAFVETSDQTIRKLVHAVSSNGILDNFTPVFIQSAAALTDLTIHVLDDKIVLPQTRSEIKALLQFLDESRYSGPLTETTFVTNSHRPV